jgi:osmotically-inducible protein OsmY
LLDAKSGEERTPSANARMRRWPAKATIRHVTDMSNAELQEGVSDELSLDPKVHNRAIAVDAHDGAVTLRGTVGTFREKREATTAARRVRGVTRVMNELQVKLMGESKRIDADFRGAVLQALMLDGAVPPTVDARVTEGVVRLVGTTDRQQQRDEAEFVAGNVLGVLGLVNEIRLTAPVPYAGDVQESILRAFERNARIDAVSLRVEASDGEVTLSGSVSSWAEHDAAVSAAWSAPGVKSVVDELFVE